MQYTYSYQTAIGRLHFVSDQSHILRIDSRAPQGEYQVKETSLIKGAAQQVLEYLAGKRKDFDIPFKTSGTPFQEKVWAALRAIPYGETRSYSQLAREIGQPKAARAVGMANNRNPLLLLCPCHRVIAADGSLGGFAVGVDMKQHLLDLETKQY